MDRKAYQDARRGYRCARRRDIEWKEPEVWAYRERTLVNQIPVHPQYGLKFIQQFPYAVVQTFFRPLIDAGRGNRRLPQGPRAVALQAAPTSGPYAGLTMNKRIALRRARKQVAALKVAA